MILKNIQIWNLFLVTLIFITACTASSPESENSTNVVPTVNPLYQEQPTLTPNPTIPPTSSAQTETTPMPTPEEYTFLPTKALNQTDDTIIVVEEAPLLSNTQAETIYGDRLAPNWSVEQSWATDIGLGNTEYAIVGENAIKIIPINEFGAILFSVRDTARKSYFREDVLGIRFWLFTYDDYVALDDLAITMQGSNDYPYWVENDDSVATAINSDRFVFSETELRYLNVSNDIPPKTWVNIELWLDDLLYDPDYEYVTGFYIKNDADFQRPYYIDDVEILLLKDSGGE